MPVRREGGTGKGGRRWDSKTSGSKGGRRGGGEYSTFKERKYSHEQFSDLAPAHTTKVLTTGVPFSARNGEGKGETE